MQAARGDVIFGTGRSDYRTRSTTCSASFIFSALDVRARKVNMEMKLAATYALANLAKDGPIASSAYGLTELRFGREKLHHSQAARPRVLMWVAPAVAKAAIDTSVARRSGYGSVPGYAVGAAGQGALDHAPAGTQRRARIRSASSLAKSRA